MLQEKEDSNTFSGNDAHYGANQGSYPASLQYFYQTTGGERYELKGLKPLGVAPG